MRPTIGPKARFVLTILAGLAAPPASWAAGPVPATREELRACMDAEDRVQQGQQALERASQRHDEDLRAQQLASRVLAEETSRNRRYSSAEADALQKRIAAHNRRVEELNQRAAVLRRQADDFNAEVGAYNLRCSSLVFRVEDREAVLAQRERAARAAAFAAGLAAAASSAASAASTP